MLRWVLLLWITPATTAFVGALGGQQKASFQLQATTASTTSNGGASVESLLNRNRARVDALAFISADVSELTRLRFVLAFPNQSDARRALRNAVLFRSRGTGLAIVTAAAQAVQQATAGGGWDNEVVRAAAPHAAAINQYISPKNILTLSTDEGDLLYVIRASLIVSMALA